MNMIWTFCKFWWKRDLKSWRELRRVCRDALPKQERKTVEENGE